MISALPRITATWRERMAVGVKFRLIWRICSPKPGISLSATASVASASCRAAPGRCRRWSAPGRISRCRPARAASRRCRPARRGSGGLPGDRVAHGAPDPILQRRDALVLVDAGGSAVADGHHARCGWGLRASPPWSSRTCLMNWNSSNARPLRCSGAARRPCARCARAAQLLRVGGRELLNEGADARVVGDQPGAPALGLVQRANPGAAGAACRAPRRIGAVSTPRISLPMYCIWRRLPSMRAAPVFVHRAGLRGSSACIATRAAPPALRRGPAVHYELLRCGVLLGRRRRSFGSFSGEPVRGGTSRRTGAPGGANGWYDSPPLAATSAPAASDRNLTPAASPIRANSSSSWSKTRWRWFNAHASARPAWRSRRVWPVGQRAQGSRTSSNRQVITHHGAIRQTARQCQHLRLLYALRSSRLRAAHDIARFTAEDPAAGLPEVEDLAFGAAAERDLDLYHPWPIVAEQVVEIALRCEAAALETDRRITNSDGAGVSAQQAHFFMGQQPRLPRRLCELRGIRSRWRRSPPSPAGAATTCSATPGTARCARPTIWPRLRRWAATLPSARRRACARARCHRRGAGAVRVHRRGRADRRAGAGHQRRRAVSQVDLPARQPGQEVLAPHLDLHEDPHVLRGRAARPSTTRAW